MSNKRGYYDEVDELAERQSKLPISSGEYLFDSQTELLKAKLAHLPSAELLRRLLLYFKDVPLSSHTQRALAKHGFTRLTEVQRCVVPHALLGRDVLAAARTGSGKTLAYLVPLVERLYARRWAAPDGLGALVILPTRELALQVFEVLRALLEFHKLTHGLLIGGKSLAAEQAVAARLNVLVCTPGRLLQHLTETVGFEADNLKYLVFDEADELFSRGFAATLTSIRELLPQTAQTLLLSATLTPDVLGLARLSLKSPEHVFAAPSPQPAYELPARLSQFFAVVPLEEKLDVVFSFLKAHSQSKVVVFVNTCKQVRHMYECFRRLRVGLPTFELQGRQQQPKRLAVFFSFAECRSACLVTTNIAARGLDFPRVDWVIQADCPDSAETYVHRVGRTARGAAAGNALLLLAPAERAFLERLSPIAPRQIFPNPAKQFSVGRAMQELCAADAELRHVAQRALISYVKSLERMSDRAVFDARRVDLAALARSFGLAQPPALSLAAPGDDATLGRAQRKLQRFKAKIAARDEEFLRVKRSAAEPLADVRGDPWRLSKNQLKKVKRGGPFEGRNVFELDDEARVVDKRRAPSVESEVETPKNVWENRESDKKAYVQRLREKRALIKEKLKSEREIIN